MSISIFDLADILNLTIEATRWPNQPGRWCVRFHGVDTCENEGDACAVGSSGNGPTVQAALCDYAKAIDGRVLVIGAHIGGNGDKQTMKRAPKDLAVPGGLA